MSTIAQQRPPVNGSSRTLRLAKPFDAEGRNAEGIITMQKGRKVEGFRYWVDKVG